MNVAQKAALSLLIAVLVFSGFAVFAFSGLFDYIETTFYDPRVTSQTDALLDRGASVISRFHEQNQERFVGVLDQPAVQSIFRVNQSREDIVARENFFGRLQSDVSALSYVRFIDNEGEGLWYSTRPQDIAGQTPRSREYVPLSQLANPPPPLDPEIADGPDIRLNAEGNQFVYRFFAEDSFGVVQGTALFYVSASGLRSELLRAGVVDAGREPVLIDGEGVVLNARQAFGDPLLAEVSRSWGSIRREGGTRAIVESEDNGVFLVFTQQLDTAGTAVLLVPQQKFEMGRAMQVVLLAATFLTSFLLVFLILNARQDAVVVLQDRIKRLQISLLREYMSNRNGNWERWREELEDRRAEVAREIKKGLGKQRGKKAEEVDELINRSWDEILDVIGKRQVETRSGGAIDFDRLENMIEQIMARLQTSAPSSPSSGAQSAITADAAGHVDSATAKPAPESEELEEAEPADEADEAEELEDAEDVEELEDLEEAEPVEDADEAEEVEELEEVEEAEPVEEEEPDIAESATQAEDLEPVEESKPVEEAESADEHDDLEELEDAEDVEELEDLEEAEPVEDVDEAEEVEELGEVEEAEPVEEEESDIAESATQAEDLEPVEEAESADEHDDVEELEDAEDVEELEDLEEAEPVEDGDEAEDVEELQEAEEAEPADGHEELASQETVSDGDRARKSGSDELDDEEDLGDLLISDEDEEEESSSETRSGVSSALEDLELHIGSVREDWEILHEEPEALGNGVRSVEGPLSEHDASSQDVERPSQPSYGNEPAREEPEYVEEEEPDELPSAEVEDEREPVELQSLGGSSDATAPPSFSTGYSWFAGPMAGESTPRSPSADAGEEQVDGELLPVEEELPESGETETSGESSGYEKNLVPDEQAEEVEELDEAEEAEEVEEFEELEELDELEELEELGDEATAERSGGSEGLSEPEESSADTRAAAEPVEEGNAGAPEREAAATSRVRSLESAEVGDHEAYELREIRDVIAQLGGGSASVFRDEDGVVQIEPELYGRHVQGSREDVQDLVDSVTHEEEEEAESTAGIDEIFGSTPALDLTGGPSPYAPLGERTPVEGRLVFSEHGLNYDGFRLDYRENDSGVFKSLVSFTRVWTARAVVILTKDDNEGFTAGYGLGVNEDCLEKFRLPSTAGVVQSIMQPRRIVLFREQLSNFEDFQDLCSEAEMEVFRRSLLLPIVFRSTPSYMLLAVRDNVASIRDFFDIGRIEVQGSDSGE